MVQNVLSRSLEGIVSQFGKFNGLSDRWKILSNALGEQVSDVIIWDLLLTRSCLGTLKVWKLLGSIAVSNINILKAAVLEYLKFFRPLNAPIAWIPIICMQILYVIRIKSKCNWKKSGRNTQSKINICREK